MLYGKHKAPCQTYRNTKKKKVFLTLILPDRSTFGGLLSLSPFTGILKEK